MSTSNYRKRKNSLRKPDWDYRFPAYYFVTFCTFQRICFFEDAEIKKALDDLWQQIPTWPQAKHVVLDRWVVMPNHIHAILYLNLDPEKLEQFDYKNTPKSLGAIIGSFKRSATYKIKPMLNVDVYQLWQRGYYDRIVRSESELNAIRHYIDLNPERRAQDQDNIDLMLEKMNYHR
ncbi:MAG: transposase [Chloroflexota bacterium]